MKRLMRTRHALPHHLGELHAIMELLSSTDVDFAADIRSDMWSIGFWCTTQEYLQYDPYPDCPDMQVRINPLECGHHDTLALSCMQWENNTWRQDACEVFVIPSTYSICDLARRQPVHVNTSRGMRSSLVTAADFKRKLHEICDDGTESWYDSFKGLMADAETWQQSMEARGQTMTFDLWMRWNKAFIVMEKIQHMPTIDAFVHRIKRGIAAECSGARRGVVQVSWDRIHELKCILFCRCGDFWLRGMCVHACAWMMWQGVIVSVPSDRVRGAGRPVKRGRGAPRVYGMYVAATHCVVLMASQRVCSGVCPERCI